MGAGWLPDEHALVVVALPQAAVALVGDGEDVGGQLAQVAPAVAIHGVPRVQARDGLVGVHGGDDGADVGLRGRGGETGTRVTGGARGGEGGIWARDLTPTRAGVKTEAAPGSSTLRGEEMPPPIGATV